MPLPVAVPVAVAAITILGITGLIALGFYALYLDKDIEVEVSYDKAKARLQVTGNKDKNE